MRPHPLLAAAAAILAGCSDPLLPTEPGHTTPSLSPVLAVAVGGPVVLDPLPNSFQDIAHGINDLGDIVGVSRIAATLWATGANVAPVSTAATHVDGPGAWGHDVNASGQIAGEIDSDPDLAGFVPHAALWTPSGTSYVRTDIGAQLVAQYGAQYSEAWAINAAGKVVGDYVVGGTIRRCFLWTPTVQSGTTGAVTDLGDLGGGYCGAQDINSSGQVTGGSRTTSGDVFSMHPYVWKDGTMTDLTPGGDVGYGQAINDAGQVAGQHRDASLALHAAIWTPSGPGTWTALDLGAPAIGGLVGSLESYASDIDDAGYVVGAVRSGTGVRAFFWENGEFTYLPGSPGPDAAAAALTNSNNGLVIVAGASNPTTIGGSDYTALRWSVQLNVVTLQGEVLVLKTLVEELSQQGVLSAGEARSLLAKLDAATRQLEQRNPTPASNLLRAFMNEVNGLVALRRLTASQAQPLLEHAQLAIGAL